MTTDLAVFAAGTFLILIALIWKAYRSIDARLSEIQADIRFTLASKFEGRISEPELDRASAGPKRVRQHDASGLLRSADLEAELTEVDGLCAKLITLVPPAQATPLVAKVPEARTAPLPSELKAESPAKFEGRRLVQVWPTRD